MTMDFYDARFDPYTDDGEPPLAPTPDADPGNGGEIWADLGLSQRLGADLGTGPLTETPRAARLSTASPGVTGSELLDAADEAVAWLRARAEREEDK